MAVSSGTHKKKHSPSPFAMHLSTLKGFGSGFRFNYDSQTSQAKWSKQKYYSANDSQDYSKETLPAFRVPKIYQDEDSLSTHERLAFAIDISIRYHQRRHQHYERVFRLMMMSIVFLASFAFMSGANARLMLGMTVIGLAAGTFVWNITHLSRLHDVIRAKYQSLWDHIKLNGTPTDNDIKHWRLIRMKIRAKEPAIYWAVANDCYYETARAWDLDPKQREKLPWMLRPFMNWLRF